MPDLILLSAFFCLNRKDDFCLFKIRVLCCRPTKFLTNTEIYHQMQKNTEIDRIFFTYALQ